MTPSVLKNADVIRMPKQRSKQVRSRISYMSSEQLERFLQAAKEYGAREHAMFLFAVAHGAFVAEGWPLMTGLLCNQSDIVLDVKTRLARTQRPDGIELWRL